MSYDWMVANNKSERMWKVMAVS